MRARLSDILSAIDISQKTSFRIKLNFVWAFLYNILGKEKNKKKEKVKKEGKGR